MLEKSEKKIQYQKKEVIIDKEKGYKMEILLPETYSNIDQFLDDNKNGKAMIFGSGNCTPGGFWGNQKFAEQMANSGVVCLAPIWSNNVQKHETNPTVRNEEWQAVIKFCQKYNLKFFNYGTSYAGQQGAMNSVNQSECYGTTLVVPHLEPMMCVVKRLPNFIAKILKAGCMSDLENYLKNPASYQ